MARVVALVLLAASAAAGCQPRSLPPPSTLALVGGRVYTAPDAAPIDRAVVLIQAGRIVTVGPLSDTSIPPAATRIDCAGLVIAAGFQNSHVHFTPPGWTVSPAARGDEVTAALQAMLTRWGFTTVIDTASDPATTGMLRERIESGELPGPRILTAGTALYPPDGVPYYVRDALPTEVVKRLPQPATPDEAVAAVRQRATERDLVKLFVGSWVTRDTVRPMPDDIALAAVREAHAARKLVFAHPSNVAGLEVALRAGVDVVAHAVEDTAGFTPAHLQRMRQQNVGVVPTLKLFGGRSHIVAWVRYYAAAGGQILFGTDVGYLSDFDPAEEYALMAAAGMGYRDTLAALTTSPALRFGETGRRGRVAPGLDADLVVLGADPAGDARAFADVRYTIRGGKVIYTSSPQSAAIQKD